MKKSIILASLLLMFVVAVQAQSISEPAVKVLPTNQPGVIKVIYGYDTDKMVNVKFFNDDMTFMSDMISGKSFKNGFTRRYDVTNIAEKSFFVEVSSENLSVVYRLKVTENGNVLVPLIENASYSFADVASTK